MWKLTRFALEILLASSVLAVGVPRAAALQTVSPLSSGEADTVFVGRVNHDGTVKHWVCYDRPGAASRWVPLTQSGNYLGDDVVVNGGTSATDGGNDTMLIVTSASYSVSGDCAGTWSPPLWNGHFIDLHGNGGNDTLYDGTTSGGTNDSQLKGEGGADVLFGYSSVAWLLGGDGADHLRALHSSSSGDILKGENHGDCLQDDSNSWTTFDCGDATDARWTGDTNTPRIDCETTAGCCGFC